MKWLHLLIPLMAATITHAQSWQEEVDRQLPLLGHRNWILVVDSAYPLQVSPGVQTFNTNADQITVLKDVLHRVAGMKHVSPIILEDQELSFLSDQDAPGVSRYRSQLKEVLGSQFVQTLPHEQIIRQIDEAGKTFRVLILKTTMTIPYTSVFLQLDCKYWGAASEKKLRASMTQAHKQ